MTPQQCEQLVRKQPRPTAEGWCPQLDSNRWAEFTVFRRTLLALGVAVDFLGNVGEGRAVPDAAARAATTAVGSVTGGAVAGGICAVTAPTIIGLGVCGGALIGLPLLFGAGAEWLYDNKENILNWVGSLGGSTGSGSP